MSYSLEAEQLKLHAVNILLRTIGELGIETLSDIDVLVEAREAESTLEEVTLAVLSERWDFNTDIDYTMPIAPDGTIPIPTNILDITSKDGNLIMRQWKLYDKQNNTFIFDEPQDVNIVWAMEFNTLTHPIRHYITIRAARIFTSRMIGDKAAFDFTSKDEESALLSARHSESRSGNYNMLSGEFGSQVATKREL